jgi:hypothetical protein
MNEGVEYSRYRREAMDMQVSNETSGQVFSYLLLD